MRRILLILLLLLCGAGPAQKRLMLQGGEVSDEQFIRNLNLPLWLDGNKPAELEPLRHFTMDDDAASTAVVDKSSNANGTLNENTANINSAGKIGGALDFDGAASAIDLGSDVIGIGADSACAWIYADGNHEGAAGGRIVSNKQFDFTVDNATTQIVFSSDANAHIATSAAGSLAQGVWHHICATRAADGTANLYTNGALSGAANQNSGTPAAGVVNVYVGNRDGADRTFNGKLDDIRIYDRALTLGEIQLIYNNGAGHQNQSVGATTGAMTVDAAGVVSEWTSKLGAVSFTAAGAAQPVTTRRDNRENRALHSQDISQATAWTPSLSSAVSATELKEDGTATNYHSIATAQPLVAGQVQRVSVLIRRGTGSRNVYIGFSGSYAAKYAIINLGNGAVAEGNAAPTVTTEGSDYRLTFLNTPGSTGNGALIFYMCSGTNSASASYSGDNASSIHITQLHVADSLADSSYQATTTYAQYRGINGRQAIRFSTDDSMVTTTAFASLLGVDSYSFALVTRPFAAASAVQQNLLTAFDAGLSPTNPFSLYTLGDSTLKLFGYDTGSRNTGAAAFVNDRPSVIIGRHIGGNQYLSTNGSLKQTSALGTIAATTHPLIIGRLNTSAFYNGEVGELLGDNDAWPPDVEARINRYLCRKWGADC